MILKNLRSHEDLLKLNAEELDRLCGELREFLIDSVSKTGGHLASNLGAVELTVALHRVFDTARDRLVFDVGHQCYVHKILSGRADRFDTLRKQGGLGGFPRPDESIHDAFVAGHASNSVSVALGMARARTLSREDYSVIALIGDGALTGGLAYEGLNDAGASGEPLIVVVNDNGMSINANVGGVAKHLGRLRVRPGYYRFKKGYHALMHRLPGGEKIYRFNHRIKTDIKKTIYPCSFFEDMGFTYLGPVDGHNVEQLCTTFRWAKDLHGPVLIHIRTKKGKGYAPAEEMPERCHGVAPFDPEQGISEKSGEDFSAAFGREMMKLAVEDERICAVTAAMAEGTGLQDFAAVYPERFFDVGIAEGHAVSMAAGMAKQGRIPVFAVYSTFLQRSFDMLIHDVALQRLHVVFAVDRAGLVGADGPTHHGCSDVGYLTQIPGMQVYCPADFRQLGQMLRCAVSDSGPVAVRYPRGGEGRSYPAWSGADASVIRAGQDVTLVAYGTMLDEVMAASQLLEERGISAEVVALHRIAPLDSGAVLDSAKKTGRLLVLEDCFENGGIGQQLAAAVAKAGISLQYVKLLNPGCRFVSQGSVAQLRQAMGIDASGVIRALEEGDL